MFRISDEPIDPGECRQTVESPSSGGFVAFEGWVRNHNDGKAVDSLEYEAYSVLAEKEGGRIIDEARERFAIEAVAAVHRVGHLAIGEMAVWVGVSAPHRDAAFAACRYVIDEIKRRVPIWKCEHYSDGRTEWVNCAACAHHPADTHVH
jgi:molybdopterin synthase catalytic subunit